MHLSPQPPRLLGAGPACRRRSVGHAAPTVTAPTASTGCRATFTDSRGGQQERILRYPDGNERRIIYPSYDDPAFQLQQQQQAAAASEALGHGRGAPVVDDDGDTYLVLEQEYLAWDECQLWGAACMSAASAPAEAPEFMRASPGGQPQHSDALAEELGSLRTAGPEEDVGALVRNSYKDSDNANMYTMRTKMANQAVQDELAMVLGKRSLASKVSVAQMKDGIVAFDCEDDAERFASYLEADYGMEVAVTPMDSHLLFRTADDVKGVVVHLPTANYLPLPYQLGSSLKGQTAWDEL